MSKYRPKKCMECGGKMQTGGYKENNGGTVYKTQAEVDAANALAKDIARRKNAGAVNPEDSYVARKVGDPMVPFLGVDGKPFVMKGAGPRKVFSVPKDITIDDIHSYENTYWYNDPSTGDLVDIDPSVMSLPRFKKSITPEAKPALNSVAKFQFGGMPTMFAENIMAANMNKGFNKFRGQQTITDKTNIADTVVDNSYGQRIGQYKNEQFVADPVKGSQFDPLMAMRLGTIGLTELSGMSERSRQNQYMYNQLSSLGQMNPMAVEDFQPNPFSLYAKFGGSIKKYQKGGSTKTIYRDTGKKFSNDAQMKFD